MSKMLLILICPPLLERAIVDWLLEQESTADFSSATIHRHGSDPEKLSLLEQVEGRKKQIKFEIQMDSSNAEVTIKQLKEDLHGSDINYWLMPVIEAGQV